MLRSIRPKHVAGWTMVGADSRASDDVASWYDRTEWRKKLQRILDGLPKTQPEWDTLISEARTLKLDPAWVTRCEREELNFMIRRAVRCRVLSEPQNLRPYP